MNPSVTLGAETTGWQRSQAYLRLGVEHILLGVDHLLFVLGLLLIVGDRWMLLKTITVVHRRAQHHARHRDARLRERAARRR